jgi:hypothetical protein
MQLLSTGTSKVTISMVYRVRTRLLVDPAKNVELILILIESPNNSVLILKSYLLHLMADVPSMC